VNPVAALAEDNTAQQQFRALSAAWHTHGSRERVALAAELQAFVERYPKEDLARPARAYLAWILYQKGELVIAERWLEPNLRGPEGSSKDFSHVVEAALLTEHGRPFDAIKLLRPLQGKIIDPVERFLATEQLVKSALAANLYAEALSYMVDWIDQAPERDRAAILSSIESRITRIPEAYLERALPSLEPGAADEGPEQDARRVSLRHWLLQSITRHLAAVALRTNDVQLAARILEKNPALALDPNAGKLVQLATGGEAPATIAGRTIGLLLETNDALGRRRSSSVAAGISFALARATQTATAGATVQLVFEQAGSDASLALSKLSAEGAALIVAGVDDPSSEAAARYAEVAHAPVLLLNASASASGFAFTLGVDVAAQQQRLSAPLVLNGERILSAGPLTQSCKGSDSPFPVQEWVSNSVTGLILLTDESCARATVQASQALGYAPHFALGLDAAALEGWRNLPADTLWLRAGHFPFASSAPADVGEFRTRMGHDPNWYEVLGRDAAQIALEVLTPLREVRSKDPGDVATYHAQVQATLNKFASRNLWSSTDAKFDAERRLTRELSVVLGTDRL
jgi:hypothetical protein